MKKSFTINPLRTKEEIASYYYLFEKKFYQGIEIFYPYNQGEKQYNEYTESIYNLLNTFPFIEVVMHLPHSPKNSLCENENLPEAIKIMKDGIDYANKFKAKKLTLHLGWIKNDIPREKYYDHIVPILKDLCDYADKYQMALMIENMPGEHEFGYSPEELKTIFEMVNKKNIKLIFDFGHANCTPWKIDEYLETLKNYLWHLHLSDNNGTRDEHKKIGLGNIDYYKVLKKLEEIKYSELYTMEVIYNTASELETFSQDLDKYITKR